MCIRDRRSYGEQGYARCKNLLENTGNDVEYRLQKLRMEHPPDSAAGRVAFLTAASEVLATLGSRIEQEVYAGKLAAEMGVDRSAVRRQIDKVSRKRRSEAQKKAVSYTHLDVYKRQRYGCSAGRWSCGSTRCR